MLRKLLAEFLGTFWLVLGGCSAVLAAKFPLVGIGFFGVAFGLSLLTMLRIRSNLWLSFKPCRFDRWKFI